MRSKQLTLLPDMNRASREGLSKKVYILYLFIGLFCIGCAEKQIVYKPVTLQKSIQTAQDIAEKTQVTAKKEVPSYEALQSPDYEKSAAKAPLAERKIPATEKIDLKRVTVTHGSVIINVENMPLSDFVIYALGETMKITFVMDEKVMSNKQLVTLRMPQAMAADKALEIVIGLLEKYGIYLEEKANALYILSNPPQPAPTNSYQIQYGRALNSNSGNILQIVPLRYTTPIEIQQVLTDVSKTTAQIKPYARGNVMLIYGQADQIKRVLDVLETFDVPYFENKKIYLLNLTYMRAADFITEIKAILSGLGFRVGSQLNEAGPLLIPIKQLNAVLLVSPDEKTAKLIIEWKEKLDTAESAGAEERAFSFVPRYSKASDLVKSIQNLYGVAPITDAAAAQKTDATKTTTTVTGGMPPGMKISADDGKNVILIIATPVLYKIIHRLLTDLDTPPRQVLIEATVVEVTLTGELKYGVEWFIKNSQSGGQYTLGTLGNLGLSVMGLSYTFISETANFTATISALATQNKANILSTPRLMVLDNKEATIQVGSDIPTVTGEISTSTTSTTTPSVLRNITYRSTGVLLRVKPNITTEGLLTLEISQEVSQPGAPGVGDSPIILTRRISTTVVVGHGQTIALGGLFKDSQAETEAKVPLLGDIPLLGNLFKYTDKTTEKTELLILVTPTILTTTDEAVKITDELKKQLKWFK
jgi:general secretion pathway protein D